MRRIKVANPTFFSNEKKYLRECIDSGWVSSTGKYVNEFENKFALFCSTRNALSCSSGTAALHLALLSLGVKTGDEVIVPSLTYVATANAVAYCGARPVLVDSEPETWNLDPTRLDKLVNHKTRGIIAVHLYGHPADMDPIMAVAKKHNLFVIEDAAEAHGALYKNKIVGSFGEIGTFSFFGNKIITTGEGGMVVTENDDLAEKMRLLRGQGMDPNRRYWFSILGYNYRMTNLQAAIGLAQLEKVSWHLKSRRKVAEMYYKYLADIQDRIELPIEKKWATHAFWMFSILIGKHSHVTRDEMMLRLDKDGIETRPVFYPMHIMPPYFDNNANLPVATDIASRGITLPTHSQLTEDDIVHIASSIKKNLTRT